MYHQTSWTIAYATLLILFLFLFSDIWRYGFLNDAGCVSIFRITKFLGALLVVLLNIIVRGHI